MNRYNWQQRDWPKFEYTTEEVDSESFLFAEKLGKVTGILSALPESTQIETVLETMVSEAIKTSEIEGEYLSRKDVMSSIRNNLGLNTHLEKVRDKKAQGIGELIIDVRNTFAEQLSREKLFVWHAMLLKDSTQVKTGAWRDHAEPMQVVSGASGKQKIHFEAPPSDRVPGEMEEYISWFNETGPGGSKEIKNAPVRSAIVHLYFETIHPFEDGNGRIGRALAEKALSQGAGRPVLLSLSKVIEADKKNYYEALEKAQRSNHITPWINYFVRVILAAQIDAEEHLDFTLQKAKFFDRYRDGMNDRQMKVVRRMLDEGYRGFAGGMNASKYGSITRVSKATATRDLQSLLELGAIKLLDGGGRSTRYMVNIGYQ
ncbi:MAG TPA: Fic family protein [Puia sp.]|nr:Fic family protein [Puia sp.]